MVGQHQVESLMDLSLVGGVCAADDDGEAREFSIMPRTSSRLSAGVGIRSQHRLGLPALGLGGVDPLVISWRPPPASIAARGRLKARLRPICGPIRHR
jgi:hypothetical protein